MTRIPHFLARAGEQHRDVVGAGVGDREVGVGATRGWTGGVSRVAPWQVALDPPPARTNLICWSRGGSGWAYAAFMAWKLMPLEEAFKLLESAPHDTASLSAEDARKLREAYLVMRGDLAEDEIRAALEADFGPVD